ncbi:hypothetical protein [Vulcanisaeta sp. JCM 16159]|uniref:hypothetical protein n=1 Tax=Vulcanisaeta sp. JCM 16159 TaxID=1295371 RepID=UPI001FB1A763|nr:hypothetical protein [Vulcanisaeta sp. JCM 16159]
MGYCRYLGRRFGPYPPCNAISLLILLTVLYRGIGMAMGIIGGLVWTMLSSGTA